MSARPKIRTEDQEAQIAALRAELKIELQNKKQCAYEPFECSHLTVSGYKYCPRHILQDKNAPFRQCAFIYTTNGKRCYLPAPKTDKKDGGLCNEHALKATLSRNNKNAKYPPPQTPEALLHSLSHYVKKPRNRTSSFQSDEGDRTAEDGAELKGVKGLDPFTDLDAYSIYTAKCNDVLDYCSEDESDCETTALATVWHDAQDDSSDNESIDSDQEDPLKHANIYTAEEITSITRDKLVRLQSLYIDQYKHLQYLLKERKRKYLHSLKREKETCCSIYNQVHDNPKEQRMYKKLKAYNKYHKTNGDEAILSKRLSNLRAKTSDGAAAKNAYSKCLYTEGGVKCGERSLPLARHCRKHILEDPNQVLFRSCGKVRADVECTTPVEAIFEDTTCRLHMDVPPIRTYNHHRKDSESDYEDSMEQPSLLQPLENATPNRVKTELMDLDSPQLPAMANIDLATFEEYAQSQLDSVMDDTNYDTNEDIKIEDDAVDIPPNVPQSKIVKEEIAAAEEPMLDFEDALRVNIVGKNEVQTVSPQKKS